MGRYARWDPWAQRGEEGDKEEVKEKAEEQENGAEGRGMWVPLMPQKRACKHSEIHSTWPPQELSRDAL